MIKLFLDLDGTLARFNVKNALIRYDKEANFFENLLPYVNLNVINHLANIMQVYIISASPHEQADTSKRKWLAKYLPNITNDNIVFCRLGENKAKVIKQQLNIDIDNTCLLLDDYTKNLNEWVSQGGVGIKRLTSVADNSRKLWKGQTINNLKQLVDII